MIAVLVSVCWFCLALPGYALLRRMSPGCLTLGWLSNLSLSYIYSFALLTPISVGCYLLGLPVGVFSCAAIGLVLIASVVLIRCVSWRKFSVQWDLVGSLGSVVVLGDAYLGGVVGGILNADARFHVARIRMLLDHGFNNWDPYFREHYFSRIYHTNLIHAVIAAITDVLPTSTLAAWSFSLPWAKLVTASGIFYLSISIFRSRRAAWLSAMLMVAYSGPIDFQIYPNQVALFWLLSMTIAAAINYVVRPSSWRLVHVAAVCALLGQVHSLYAVIAILALGPILVLRLLIARSRHPEKCAQLLAVLGCLLLPVPYLAASRFVQRSRIVSTGVSNVVKPFGVRNGLLYLKTGGFVVDPTPYLDPSQWQFWMIPCCGTAWWLSRRKSLELFVASLGATSLFMFVPMLSSTLVSMLGTGDWVVRRLVGVHLLAVLTLFPACLLLCLKKIRVRSSVLFSLCVLVLVTGVYARGLTGSKRWGWHRHITVTRTASRGAYLSYLRRKKAFLKSAIPAGSVVLASKLVAPELVMLHDVYVLVSKHSSPDLPNHVQRSRDHYILWSRKSPWEKRAAVLAKHEIGHVALSTKSDKVLRRIYGAHATGKHIGAGLVVLHLEDDI